LEFELWYEDFSIAELMKVACKIDDEDLVDRGWKSFDCFGGKTCLILKDEKGLRGFVNVCPHMGGSTEPTAKDDGTKVLKCTFHAAEFDIITGQRLSGLAPEGSGLRALTVEEKGGVIYYS